jgi:SAM-dependent methyltransferase
MDELRRDWAVLGAEDPLWAVLMRPGTRHGRWDVEQFLATGRAEVDASLAHLSRLGVPGPFATALDLGAGVGRLTQALAMHVGAVVGVDISAPMLATARELDQTAGRCEFLLNDEDDLSLLGARRFDLVYSSLVLQHLPPSAADAMLAELCRVTRSGGALVVQVAGRPTRSLKGLLFRYAPHRLLRVGQRLLLGYPAPMRMHGMAPGAVRRIIEQAGLEVLDVTQDDRYGGHWTYDRYFAHRPGPTREP